MSALETYNKIAKDMGVTDELNVSPIAKLSFARAQAQEMQTLINRFLFDITIAKTKLSNAKDRDTKAAAENKVREYETQLAQIMDGLVIAMDLVQGLEAQVQAD